MPQIEEWPRRTGFSARKANLHSVECSKKHILSNPALRAWGGLHPDWVGWSRLGVDCIRIVDRMVETGVGLHLDCGSDGRDWSRIAFVLWLEGGGRADA